MHVPVVEQATGRILQGMDAPLQANLDVFLAANPGWEVLPLDDTDTSEDEKGECRWGRVWRLANGSTSAVR